ncbi:uncharacterized protein LTR77_009515 [Saxophila tyrrhenica]|uniref:Uncharacterized protein n=1 Tax=Saxophila tyrrhenica TaxID=1690608 RepID=A0AAV9NY20_9PEZI|nr:hypothetical protein LTR77_009515 [Saxophila tyrrhenica]
MCIYDLTHFACSAEAYHLYWRCHRDSLCLPHVRWIRTTTSFCRLCTWDVLEGNIYLPGFGPPPGPPTYYYFNGYCWGTEYGYHLMYPYQNTYLSYGYEQQWYPNSQGRWAADQHQAPMATKYPTTCTDTDAPGGHSDHRSHADEDDSPPRSLYFTTELETDQEPVAVEQADSHDCSDDGDEQQGPQFTYYDPLLARIPAGVKASPRHHTYRSFSPPLDAVSPTDGPDEQPRPRFIYDSRSAAGTRFQENDSPRYLREESAIPQDNPYFGDGLDEQSSPKFLYNSPFAADAEAVERKSPHYHLYERYSQQRDAESLHIHRDNRYRRRYIDNYAAAPGTPVRRGKEREQSSSEDSLGPITASSVHSRQSNDDPFVSEPSTAPERQPIKPTRRPKRFQGTSPPSWGRRADTDRLHKVADKLQGVVDELRCFANGEPAEGYSPSAINRSYGSPSPRPRASKRGHMRSRSPSRSGKHHSRDYHSYHDRDTGRRRPERRLGKYLSNFTVCLGGDTIRLGGDTIRLGASNSPQCKLVQEESALTKLR